MTLFKNKYRVESTRLKNHDYSENGYYFVTVCVKNREYLFGEIENGSMKINEYGTIVKKCWDDLGNHYENLQLGEFVIMPNHVHGIMIIDNDIPIETGYKQKETGYKPVSTKTKKKMMIKKHGISEFVRAFKTFSSRRINKLRNAQSVPVWQTRYYDHIIQNEKELSEICDYINNNPLKWEEDELNICINNVIIESD